MNWLTQILFAAAGEAKARTAKAVRSERAQGSKCEYACDEGRTDVC